jgi:outer membrane biosynthesis protein TonB
VTALGDVSDVKLITGSGTESVDAEIERQMAQSKYEPALLDGIPLPGVYRTDRTSPRP